MSKPPTETTEKPQRECLYCGNNLDSKGICWSCYDQLNADLAAQDPDRLERIRAYRGGRWIVDAYIRTSRSEAEAIAAAEKPENIQFALELSGFHGLVDILADRWATEALRQLILARDEQTLSVLSSCHKGGRFFPAKRGPKPKGGIHLEEQVLRLKRAGKTNGEIAKLLGTKMTTIAAAYNNITKKIARQQIFVTSVAGHLVKAHNVLLAIILKRQNHWHLSHLKGLAWLVQLIHGRPSAVWVGRSTRWAAHVHCPDSRRRSIVDLRTP